MRCQDDAVIVLDVVVENEAYRARGVSCGEGCPTLELPLVRR